MRPSEMQVGSTLYWVLLTRNPDTMQLKDADATPTVAVRKNGASVGDSVTVTKRSATTGIYDCAYDPAGEVETDSFILEERAQVTGTDTAQAYYDDSFVVRVIAVALDENGVDNALAAYGSSGVAGGDAVQAVYDQVDGLITVVNAIPNAGENADAVRTELNTDIVSIKDRLGYLMAQEIGACADAGTSGESYTITIDTTTYTIDHTGLTSDGDRGTATLTKS